jgi:fido (protein-threonine AMPylation protein)
MATHPQAESAPSWPALAFEERPWSVPDGISRSQRRRLRNRYLAPVVTPIAGVDRIELPLEVEGLVADASAEIARFDAEVGADLAPFSAVLLRSESAASSKIENLTASAKAIALAELGDRRRHNAAVIVANGRAMSAALRLADRLDEDAILSMHSALLATTHPEWCGHWRTEQVWIGGSNWGPFDASYVAPHPDRVPEAMADLVRLLARDDIAPLTLAAVAHAQFETIHPFPDGNGRVGRALIQAVLRHRRLTRLVTVPVSAGLLVDTDSYVRCLDAVRGTLFPWCAGWLMPRTRRWPTAVSWWLISMRSGPDGTTGSRPGGVRQLGAWPTSCSANRSSTRHWSRRSGTHRPGRWSERSTHWPEPGC